MNNLNQLWNQMKKAQNEAKPKKENKQNKKKSPAEKYFSMANNISVSNNSNNNNNNNKNNNNNNTRNNVNMQYQFNENAPPEIVQEDKIVISYIVNLYHTIYPMKVDTFPSNWVSGILGTYQSIRIERSNKLKGKEKEAMKGLQMHVIVGVILYCILIQDGRPMPITMIIYYMNKVKENSQMHSKRAKVTLGRFEEYRLDDKKGIKKYIKGRTRCYEDVSPERFIPFISRDIFRLTEIEIRRAQSLARRVYYNTNIFSENTQTSTIAFACMVINSNKQLNTEIFGIPMTRLESAVNKIREFLQKEQTNAILKIQKAVKKKYQKK